MIGRSLHQRYELGRLDDDRAVLLVEKALAAHAKPLVEVRAQSARMIACLVLDADKRAVRMCREIGFELRAASNAVFGLLGEDAARLFTRFSAAQRAWLIEPCGPRETKVMLVADGVALLSLTTDAGRVAVRALP